MAEQSDERAVSTTDDQTTDNGAIQQEEGGQNGEVRDTVNDTFKVCSHQTKDL